MMIGIYVRDQDEAKAFYTDKLGFSVHTDVGAGGPYRWLTVQAPGETTQLGLLRPGPYLDEDARAQLDGLVARGAMPPLTLEVADCRAEYARLEALGVDMTQAPVQRFGTWDAGFRDPSGNAWKLLQARS